MYNAMGMIANAEDDIMSSLGYLMKALEQTRFFGTADLKKSKELI